MSNHRANGQFAPGNQAAVGKGRPSKKHEQEVLDTLKATFPPDEIAGILQEALDIARKQNSARTMAAIAQTILDYTVGRPRPMDEGEDADRVAHILALLAPKPREPEPEAVALTEYKVVDEESE